ncbi:MAG: sensor histidine kinase [Acidimicrobiia bacterium]
MPTPIEDVVQSVVSRLRRHLNAERLIVRVREGIPPLPMDVLQIDQALSNLLENAYRYASGSGEIEILARRWQSWAEIEVVDHGPGIPSEDRERVFEEFYRGEHHDKTPGTGLGLSIARAIVDAHGGEMWIHETPGGGATIGFRLPIEPASKRA